MPTDSRNAVLRNGKAPRPEAWCSASQPAMTRGEQHPCPRAIAHGPARHTPTPRSGCRRRACPTASCACPLVYPSTTSWACAPIRVSASSSACCPCCCRATRSQSGWSSANRAVCATTSARRGPCGRRRYGRFRRRRSDTHQPLALNACLIDGLFVSTCADVCASSRHNDKLQSRDSVCAVRVHDVMASNFRRAFRSSHAWARDVPQVAVRNTAPVCPVARRLWWASPLRCGGSDVCMQVHSHGDRRALRRVAKDRRP